MVKNMVFKGGGVLGYAYCGTFTVLEQARMTANLEKVAGASAGAIMALLVALKYSAAEIKTIVGNLNFATLEDGWDPLRIPGHYGLYSGDNALKWIDSLIIPKAGEHATFGDLRGKGFLDLQVVAACLNTQSAFVFSADKTPHVFVAEAVRASMSIPFFFKAVQITGLPDAMFVDGGTVWNYPLTIFDTNGANMETLGLYLHDFTPSLPDAVGFNDIGQFVKKLFEMLLDAQDIDVCADPSIESRTIRIDDLGISATDFHIYEADKDRLFQSGIDAGKKYITSKNASL